jgi:hypothetical protein
MLQKQHGASTGRSNAATREVRTVEQALQMQELNEAVSLEETQTLQLRSSRTKRA